MKTPIHSSKATKTQVFLPIFLVLVITGLFFSFGIHHAPITNMEKENTPSNSTKNNNSLVKQDFHFEYISRFNDILALGESMSLTPYFLFIKNQERRRAEKAQRDSLRKIALIYAHPSEAGLDQEKLLIIDSIVLDAIEWGAMPGAQVFVARRGRIVYEKAFGDHDYFGETPLQSNDLFDIASITKIAATTLASMKLTQEGRLDLDAPLGSYFKDTIIHYPEMKMDTLIKIDSVWLADLTPKDLNLLKGSKDITIFGDSLLVQKTKILTPETPETNIFRVAIRNFLVHQSGLNPSLPILPYYHYADTFEKIISKRMDHENLMAYRMESYEEIPSTGNGIILEETAEIDPQPVEDIFFTFDREEAFAHFYSKTLIPGEAETKVADSMYLKKDFRDSLFADARRIKVHHDPAYQYACINMILLQMAIDSINGVDLDTYLKNEFFQQLGMKNTTFNPLNHFPKERIVPTETDDKWRRQIVHGTVHDPSAALMGGIAGNAGLFSTASDLGIFGQMLLNGGAYNGIEYLDAEIIDQFTSRQHENHRGLGFDKPSANGVHAKDLHPDSYGHLGFTGGALWIDPVNEIVFVFLSNRVTPSATNNLFSQLRVRQNVHQAVYDALID